MKLTFTSIAAASLLVSATCGSAQKPSPTGWWSNLPKCAADCALKTADILGCAVNDISCLCSVKSVKFSRLELVFNDCLAKTSCSKTDYYTAQAIVRGLCGMTDGQRLAIVQAVVPGFVQHRGTSPDN